MAVTGQPLINGTAYTHADIKLNIAGQPIVEISEISYSDNQEITLNYGTGNQPTSRGFGVVAYEGSITVSMKEMERLRALSPTGRVQDIPDFPIIVAYATDSGDFRRDSLLFCRFKGNSVSSSQGDTMTAVTMELSIADIRFNF